MRHANFHPSSEWSSVETEWALWIKNLLVGGERDAEREGVRRLPEPSLNGSNTGDFRMYGDFGGLFFTRQLAFIAIKCSRSVGACCSARFADDHRIRF
jgi:hypothetical protein